MNDLVLVQRRRDVPHVDGVLRVGLGHLAADVFHGRSVLEKGDAVGVVDGSLHRVGIRKIHKAVPLGLPCLPVTHDLGTHHSPVLGKLGLQIKFLNV